MNTERISKETESEGYGWLQRWSDGVDRWAHQEAEPYTPPEHLNRYDLYIEENEWWIAPLWFTFCIIVALIIGLMVV